MLARSIGNKQGRLLAKFFDLVGFNVPPPSIDNYTFLQPYSNYTVGVGTDGE